jgi:anti-sigma regulatory factor (Ser/Thr protein kinase)
MPGDLLYVRVVNQHGGHVLDVELAREATAPRAARILVEERFAAELSDRELETTQLLVSELVTNAVVHGWGRIRLRARLNADRLLVEVMDEGRGIPSVVPPWDVRNPTAGGRGLAIVDAESSRWGIQRGKTSHVWFELERRGSRITDSASAAVDESA